jgi:hypothetical protein
MTSWWHTCTMTLSTTPALHFLGLNLVQSIYRDILRNFEISPPLYALGCRSQISRINTRGEWLAKIDLRSGKFSLIEIA